MTDVPLLACWVLAFACLLAAETDRRRILWPLLGALFIGLGCLVKYTSLVLLPVLALWLWWRARRHLWTLLVPIGLLAAWSAFNVWDYGGVHLLGRRISVSEDSAGPLAAIGLTVGRGALWVLTLGAIAPFTIAFARRAALRFGGRRLGWTLALALPFFTVGGQLLAAYGPDVLRGETIVHSFLRGLFFLNGLLVIGLAVDAARRSWARPGVPLLALWAAGVAGFIVVLSPFVAVRHVLLALPPLLALLLVDRDAQPSPRAQYAALVLSLGLGLGVGVADWRTADVYRDLPAVLAEELSGAERVHYLGHWGFQHYAEAAGWEPYVPGQTELRPGDRIVRPRMVDQPEIAEADAARLQVVATRVVEAGPLDLFRTITPRLGYYSVWHGLPWTLTFDPIDTVEVLEVSQAAQPSSPINGT